MKQKCSQMCHKSNAWEKKLRKRKNECMLSRKAEVLTDWRSMQDGSKQRRLSINNVSKKGNGKRFFLEFFAHFLWSTWLIDNPLKRHSIMRSSIHCTP